MSHLAWLGARLLHPHDDEQAYQADQRRQERVSGKHDRRVESREAVNRSGEQVVKGIGLVASGDRRQ